MAAQKRSTSRNYIELLEEAGDKRHAVEVPPASSHPIKDYLLGLVAAMRSAPGETK